LTGVDLSINTNEGTIASQNSNRPIHIIETSSGTTVTGISNGNPDDQSGQPDTVSGTVVVTGSNDAFNTSISGEMVMTGNDDTISGAIADGPVIPTGTGDVINTTIGNACGMIVGGNDETFDSTASVYEGALIVTGSHDTLSVNDNTMDGSMLVLIGYDDTIENNGYIEGPYDASTASYGLTVINVGTGNVTQTGGIERNVEEYGSGLTIDPPNAVTGSTVPISSTETFAIDTSSCLGDMNLIVAPPSSGSSLAHLTLTFGISAIRG